MQIHNQNTKTNWRQQQIPNCGRREDETDARAVRESGRVQNSARGSSRQPRCTGHMIFFCSQAATDPAVQVKETQRDLEDQDISPGVSPVPFH